MMLVVILCTVSIVSMTSVIIIYSSVVSSVIVIVIIVEIIAIIDIIILDRVCRCGLQGQKHHHVLCVPSPVVIENMYVL